MLLASLRVPVLFLEQRDDLRGGLAVGALHPGENVRALDGRVHRRLAALLARDVAEENLLRPPRRPRRRGRCRRRADAESQAARGAMGALGVGLVRARVLPLHVHAGALLRHLLHREALARRELLLLVYGILVPRRQQEAEVHGLDAALRCRVGPRRPQAAAPAVGAAGTIAAVGKVTAGAQADTEFERRHPVSPAALEVRRRFPAVGLLDDAGR
mmetsp:Transcript_70193/g.203523  ORF Transcript_70193/g.203523 Transcript_70193/m.203523 type:complete len:215 (+) Transcript_70193:1006-1650(+)